MRYFVDEIDRRNLIVENLLSLHNLEVFKFDLNNINKINSGDYIIFSPAKKFVELEVERLPNNTLVVCGNVKDEIAKIFQNKNIKHINLMNDEIFTIKNANLTAEGVLGIIIEKSERSIFDNNVLILGNGRIAKALSILLGRIGMKFAIASFNPLKYASNFTFSNKCYYKYEFLSELKNYDVIINTVPAKIIEDEMIDKFNINTLFIETASVDCLDKEKVKNFDFVPAPALPQKYCLETAGKLVFESIMGENKYD